MSLSSLKFALFGNKYQTQKSTELQRVLDILREAGVRLAIDREYGEFISANGSICLDGIEKFDGDDFSADFVISMGGDGTFLMAANRVGSKQIPIIGINMGRLGFLADINSNDIDTELGAIIRGEYNIEERTVICIESDGKPLVPDNCALNDIAILKRDNASMISIRASINGEYLVTYQADGLIVSTPTGSTAYSLSNGGPIIVPQTGVLCLSPVAPHSLSIRPIVIDNSSEITLEVKSRSHNFLVAIDGRSEKHHEGVRITIKKAPYVVRVLKKTGRRYFSTLREKMMWGADTRD